MNHKPTHSGADDFPKFPIAVPFPERGTRHLQGSLPEVEMTPWGRTRDWELVAWGF